MYHISWGLRARQWHVRVCVPLPAERDIEYMAFSSVTFRRVPWASYIRISAKSDRGIGRYVSYNSGRVAVQQRHVTRGRC